MLEYQKKKRRLDSGFQVDSQIIFKCNFQLQIFVCQLLLNTFSVRRSPAITIFSKLWTCHLFYGPRKRDLAGPVKISILPDPFPDDQWDPRHLACRLGSTLTLIKARDPDSPVKFSSLRSESVRSGPLSRTLWRSSGGFPVVGWLSFLISVLTVGLILINVYNENNSI